MNQSFSEKKSKESIRETLQKSIEEAKAASKDEIMAKPESEIGACCLSAFGVSSCTDSITKKACQKAAQNTGAIDMWVKGKTCLEIDCS